MKILILGVGNPILNDDVSGIVAARQIYEKVKSEGIFYAESSYAGWRLLDLFLGYDKVVIIDVIQTDKRQVGECYKIEPKNLAINLQFSHGVGLLQSIELAKQNGWLLPNNISIYAVEVENVNEFGEKISPQVVKKMPEIVNKIIQEEF